MKLTSRQPTQRLQRAADVVIFTLSRENSGIQSFLWFSEELWFSERTVWILVTIFCLQPSVMGTSLGLLKQNMCPRMTSTW